MLLWKSHIFSVFLSLSDTFIRRPPPPPSQLSIISHDQWALRHCQNSPAPKIPIPVFAPPSSLTLLLSSSPPFMHAGSLAEGVRQGRGSPTPTQLPFYCFWGGSFLIFLCHFHSCPLSSLTQPLPLLSVLWLCVHQVLSITERTEKERERERESAQAQLEVLLFFFSFFFFLLVHLFCVASIFHPPAWPGKHLLGSVLSGPLFSLIPLLIPRLLLALQWRASFHVCNSRPSGMRIIAAACSCHNPVGCWS